MSTLEAKRQALLRLPRRIPTPIGIDPGRDLPGRLRAPRLPQGGPVSIPAHHQLHAMEQTAPQRFTHQFMEHYNQTHGFDAALDALRSKGLNQEQFDNLQAGKLPGHFNGMFMGMSPEQLREVAKYVNPQGVQQATGAFDPITGVRANQMHFSYNDPRAEGQAGATDTTSQLPPWLRPPASHPVGYPGGPGGPPPIGHPVGQPGHPVNVFFPLQGRFNRFLPGGSSGQRGTAGFGYPGYLPAR